MLLKVALLASLNIYSSQWTNPNSFRIPLSFIYSDLQLVSHKR